MSGFNYPQEMWDKRFSTPEYLFGEEPNAFLASQAHRFPSGKALALADGEGRNSAWLATMACPLWWVSLRSNHD